jgi:hypothetical protein
MAGGLLISSSSWGLLLLSQYQFNSANFHLKPLIRTVIMKSNFNPLKSMAILLLVRIFIDLPLNPITDVHGLTLTVTPTSLATLTPGIYGAACDVDISQPSFGDLYIVGGMTTSAGADTNNIFFCPASMTGSIVPLTSPALLAASARSFAGLGYDSISSMMILFGGENGGTIRQDTVIIDWTDTNPAWRTFLTAPNPPARHQFAYSSHPLVSQFWIHGGIGTGNILLSDLWMFDFRSEKWSQVNTTGVQPSARSQHVGRISPVDSLFYIYGGAGAASCNNFLLFQLLLLLTGYY